MRDQENITPIDQFVIDFIRDLRMKKNLSQQGLADILQVSKSYISSIESTNSRAKYNLRYLNILADHFDMSPREFLPFKPVSLELTNKSKQAVHKPLKKKTIKNAIAKK
jgi:transcriptional regulator with XRE-family HTH domain